MLNQIIIDILLFLTNYTQNLGFSIVVFTILSRIILFPVTQISLKSAQKMKELQPEIKKLQEKYKKNPQAFQKAQMELYGKNKINPLIGCLPQVAQIVLLIVLYQALINFFKQVDGGGFGLDLRFLWMDISKPDKLYILPILTGLAQLGLSWVMIWDGGKKNPTAKKQALAQKKNKKKKEGVGNEIADSFGQAQKQMLFLMPVITLFVSLGLPSGLVLYWFVSSLFSDGQQLYLMRNKIFEKVKK